MRWSLGGSSDDVEDRRDSGGIGGFVIIAILSLGFHRNLFTLLDTGSSVAGYTTPFATAGVLPLIRLFPAYSHDHVPGERV